MKKYFLLATVKDRIDLLEKFLKSIIDHTNGWTLVAVTQGFNNEDYDRLENQFPENTIIVSTGNRLGMHSAKRLGIEKIISIDKKNFIICSVDDDMEFIPETSLETCFTQVIQPFTGFVSAGWVNSESKIKDKARPQVYAKQSIVYTGGGMLFNRKIAEMILAIPNLDYFSDNTIWSLQAYIEGYRNYRFLGSVAIHRVCKTGGRRSWMHTTEKSLPDSELITITAGSPKFKTKNNYLIGTSQGLTEKAHQLHKKNYK